MSCVKLVMELICYLSGIDSPVLPSLAGWGGGGHAGPFSAGARHSALQPWG